MYVDMHWWAEIRRRVLIEGVSKRQILAESGMPGRLVGFNRALGGWLPGSLPWVTMAWCLEYFIQNRMQPSIACSKTRLPILWTQVPMRIWSSNQQDGIRWTP